MTRLWNHDGGTGGETRTRLAAEGAAGPRGGTGGTSGKRAGPRVGVGGVLAAAARAGRRYWPRILPVTIAVSLVTAVIEIVVEEYVDRANSSLSIVADISASGVSLLGAVFLSGYICRLLSDERDDDTGVLAVLRTLPWGRLAGADLLVSAIVVVALLLLVIPGLVAISFLGLTGSVIEVEDRRVIAAMRRSAHLARGHFWTVALLVTLPVALAGEIDAAAPEPGTWHGILANLGIRGLAEAIAEAAIALVLVSLSKRLIELDRQRAGITAQ